MFTRGARRPLNDSAWLLGTVITVVSKLGNVSHKLAMNNRRPIEVAPEEGFEPEIP